MTGLLHRGALGFCLLLCASLGLPAIAKDKLIVMELTPGAEVSAEVAAGLTEAVAVEVARPNHYHVMSTREVQALIGVERQRHLLGCSQAAECMTEIGSALGARYLLRGSVGRLGVSYQLALQMVDTKKGETVSRSVRIARSVDELRARVPFAVATATGLTPPPKPSVVPALASFGGGATLLVGGAILGGIAALDDATLRREQDLGVEGAVGPRSTYEAARSRLFVQKTGALSAMVVGAGLLTLGVFLLPKDLAGEELALSVGPGSIVLAGVFP